MARPSRCAIPGRLPKPHRKSHSRRLLDDEQSNRSSELVHHREQTGRHDPLSSIHSYVHLVFSALDRKATGPPPASLWSKLSRYPIRKVTTDLYRSRVGSVHPQRHRVAYAAACDETSHTGRRTRSKFRKA